MNTVFKGNIKDLPQEYKDKVVSHYNTLVDEQRTTNLKWFPEKDNPHLYHKITSPLEECEYFNGNAYLSQYVEDTNPKFKKEVVWQYFEVNDEFIFYFQSKMDPRWYAQYGDIYQPTGKVKILEII